MKTKIVDLSKRFGKETVLDSLDCELDQGQLVALIGMNGAGKTTLLKTLATLLIPSAGQIYFDDEQLVRSRTDLRSRLHYLSDTPFFVAPTAVDHICMAATLYNRPLDGLKDQIVDWLRQFDLLDVAEKRLTKLSRGQKYKVAFIGLLAANPDLWLLDEPFAAGVDPPGISAMKRCINKALGAGRTVLYSTQIVELAERFSDRVLVLHKGSLKSDFKTAQLDTGGKQHTLARLFEHLKVSK